MINQHFSPNSLRALVLLGARGELPTTMPDDDNDDDGVFRRADFLRPWQRNVQPIIINENIAKNSAKLHGER